jgi:hypothetical protein
MAPGVKRSLHDRDGCGSEKAEICGWRVLKKQKVGICVAIVGAEYSVDKRAVDGVIDGADNGAF